MQELVRKWGLTKESMHIFFYEFEKILCVIFAFYIYLDRYLRSTNNMNKCTTRKCSQFWYNYVPVPGHSLD